MVDRTDAALSDIDWFLMLRALAEASDFSGMVGPLYESGVLVGEYQGLLPDDRDPDALADLVEGADLPTLRAVLTALVRDDHFAPGFGDQYFWEGDLDMVIEAIADLVGEAYLLPYGEYGLPRRLPPCPTCGSTDALARRVFGMPAAPPKDSDEDRVIYAGCVMDGDSEPQFRCRRDGTDFDFPYRSELDDWVFDSGVASDD